MRSRCSQRRSWAVGIFIGLQTIFTLTAIYEIVAIYYVISHDFDVRPLARFRILTIVASGCSCVYTLMHWFVLTSSNDDGWKRRCQTSSRPIAIVYLCLLGYLWVAAVLTGIKKAFEHLPKGNHGPAGPGLSSRKLEQVNAVLAGAMAGLTFALLLFVLWSGQILHQSLEHNQEQKQKMQQPSPMHRSWTPTRSISDSQTLRPSYDTHFLPTKLSPSCSNSPQRYIQRDVIPRLNLQQFPCLDFETANYRHPAFKPELDTLIDNSSQANLLPSPMAPPLPWKPDRTTSMRSHPPLSTAHTGLATATSSIYSRSPSTDSLFSRQPTPLSSRSNATYSHHAPTPLFGRQKAPDRPPTPHHTGAESRSFPMPIFPDSKTPMPPAPLWLYAQNIEKDQNTFLNTEAQQHHARTNSQPHQYPPPVSPTNPRDSRKASILHRNTLFQHAFCDTDAAGPIADFPLRPPSPPPSAERGPRHQGSYERLRKGTPMPAHSGGRVALERRLTMLAAAGMGKGDVRPEEVGGDGEFELCREKGKGRRVGKKVAKMRMPSSVF